MKRLLTICLLLSSAAALAAPLHPCPAGFFVGLPYAHKLTPGEAVVLPPVIAHLICVTDTGDILIPGPIILQGAVVNMFTATAPGLSAGQVVKLDAANANSVVVAATTDIAAGIAIGVVLNSPASAGTAFVAIMGKVASPVIGTGTCAIGNFVIVDTTTNGRVKCSAVFAAGTVLGRALTTGAGVGTTVTVLLHFQ
jgi:hypothetical protein